MKHEKRSLEQLVEEQLSKWTCLSKEEKEEKIKIAESNPVITISREPGSGTPEIARQLSDRLQMELIAGQIAQQVAKSAERSEKVVKSMLEKEITTRNDWLTSLFASRHLKPERFLFHLTKVISAIGRHGNAIIIGLGAQYILPPEKTFRVRLMGPLEHRVKRIMSAKSCSRAEAERYAIATESERRAFIRQYYNADLTNPCDYDLILNIGTIPVDGAVETIISAFEAWKKEKNI